MDRRTGLTDSAHLRHPARWCEYVDRRGEGRPGRGSSRVRRPVDGMGTTALGRANVAKHQTV